MPVLPWTFSQPVGNHGGSSNASHLLGLVDGRDQQHHGRPLERSEGHREGHVGVDFLEGHRGDARGADQPNGDVSSTVMGTASTLGLAEKSTAEALKKALLFSFLL